MTTSYTSATLQRRLARPSPDEGAPVAQRSILQFLEYLFVITVLIVCLNGWRAAVMTDDSVNAPKALTDSNPAFQAFSGTLYLVAALFVLAHFSRFVRLCRANLPLILLLAIVVMSCAWSNLPLVSLRR